MPIKFLQEKSRFSKYIYDFANHEDFDAQFMKLQANTIYFTLAPLNQLSLIASIKSNQLNSPIVTLQDGVYDFANALKNKKHNNLKLNMPSVNKNILCLGNHERDILRILNPDATILSYRPRFINMILKSTNIKKAKTDFLITTANTAYFNDFEFKSLIKLINWLIIVISDQGYSFKVRIFDKKIIQELKVNNIEIDNVIDKSFSEIISDFTAVLTTPSTISVEAMLSNKPVGTIYYRDEPLLTQTGWIIHKSVDLKKVLLEMHTAEPNRMAIQFALLKNYIDVDIEKLDITSISKNQSLLKINECIESESARLLSSKFNFNLKYLIKKFINKYKSTK